MTSGPSADGARQTYTLYCGGTVAGMSDAQLLDRFLTTRGEASEVAFRALVSRHGPMVLGVCQRILSEHDAEDAFQATFLILVRKAGSVRAGDSLGRWLYGVSRRVAVRARSIAARRQAREVSGTDHLIGRATDVDRIDVRSVLDEELLRLPESHRAAVVLCDLQGLTQEEAARQLRCPVGTIKSRLSRARERLRDRLSRRGLAPPAVIFAPETLSSAVPPALADATVRAAMGSATSSVVSLMKGVLKTMILAKLQQIALVLVTIGVVTGGTLLLAQQGEQAPEAPARKENRPQPVVKPEAAKRVPARYVVEPPDLLIIEVLETLPGRPISGERVVRPDGTISLGFYGDIHVAGLTTTEIKERVIEKLRRLISDEALGLIGEDPTTEKMGPVAPKDSPAVFVDVASYNSKFYYVDGEVIFPGRFPVRGNETLRDALHRAGGLTLLADRDKIRLIRPGSPQGGNTSKVIELDIDYRELVSGTDPKINYQLNPSDRIIVARDSKVKLTDGDVKKLNDTRIKLLEERMQTVEGKLDRILQELKALKTNDSKPMP